MDIKPTEVLVKMVQELQATKPNATRADIRRLTGASNPRLKALSDEGYFVWPAPVSRRSRHLYSNQSKWRKFKLFGSPTGEKNA